MAAEDRAAGGCPPMLDERRLLAVIEGIVEQRQPMVGIKTLAQRLGVSRTGISNAMERLTKAGAIRIERSLRSRRVVLADGRATGWTVQGGTGGVPRAALPVRPSPILCLVAGGTVPASHVQHYAALPPSSRRCSWPTWPHDVAAAPVPPTFCDAPAAGNHSYCVQHCARAYLPWQRAA